MYGRDESFSVSILKKATGKKVDEIVPFTRVREEQRGGREKGHSCFWFYLVENLDSADGDLKMRLHLRVATLFHLNARVTHCNFIVETEQALYSSS